MKVRVGYLSTTYGTIEDGSKGLRLKGDTKRLRMIVGTLKGDQSNADFLRTLPHRLRGYNWAQDVSQDERDS